MKIHVSIMGLAMVLLSISAVQAAPIRVLVWDEQQAEQKQAYDNFLGNRIAESLRSSKDFEVRTATIHDPKQGLSDAVLDTTDVLIWWGHKKNQSISEATGKRIVELPIPGA